MNDDWQPLSARESGRPTGLREGVPDGLTRPLRAWIEWSASSLPSEVVERLGVLLDIDLDKFWVGGSPHGRLAKAPPNDKLLEVADAVLHALATSAGTYAGKGRAVKADKTLREDRRSLQQLLDDARSVYEVKDDCTGLERRVDPVAAGLVARATTAATAKTDAGSAAKQLREASEAIRALHPNAPFAYSLTIKAVESAAHAVIEPNNTKATLGTMLGILDANPAAFEVEIAGKDRGKGLITPVTGMMRMLWDGQTSRHGSRQPTREEMREEAEMAVQLASVLVLWFASGMVRRK